MAQPMIKPPSLNQGKPKIKQSSGLDLIFNESPRITIQKPNKLMSDVDYSGNKKVVLAEQVSSMISTVAVPTTRRSSLTQLPAGNKKISAVAKPKTQFENKYADLSKYENDLYEVGIMSFTKDEKLDIGGKKIIQNLTIDREQIYALIVGSGAEIKPDGWIYSEGYDYGNSIGKELMDAYTQGRTSMDIDITMFDSIGQWLEATELLDIFDEDRDDITRVSTDMIDQSQERVQKIGRRRSNAEKRDIENNALKDRLRYRDMGMSEAEANRIQAEQWPDMFKELDEKGLREQYQLDMEKYLRAKFREKNGSPGKQMPGDAAKKKKLGKEGFEKLKAERGKVRQGLENDYVSETVKSSMAEYDAANPIIERVTPVAKQTPVNGQVGGFAKIRADRLAKEAEVAMQATGATAGTSSEALAAAEAEAGMEAAAAASAEAAAAATAAIEAEVATAAAAAVVVAL